MVAGLLKMTDRLFIIAGSCLIILIATLIDYNIQKLIGNKIFYGILIPDELKENDNLKSIDKKYKKGIMLTGIVSALVLLSSVFIIDNHNFDAILSGLTLASIFLMIIFFFRTYIIANKAVLSLKNEFIRINAINVKKESVIDFEFMESKERIVDKFKYVLAIPVVLVAIASVYAIVSRNPMLEYIPIHFNFYGEADGFVKNTVLAYYINALYPFLLLLFVYIMAIGSLKSRVKLDVDDTENSRDHVLSYIKGLGYSFLLMIFSFSLLMVSVLLAIVSGEIANVYIMVAGSIGLIVSVIPLTYLFVKLKKHYRNRSYSIDDEDKYWTFGSLYNNPDDPSIFVNKRFGIGWTINIGSKEGKILIVLFVLILLVIIAMPFL